MNAETAPQDDAPSRSLVAVHATSWRERLGLIALFGVVVWVIDPRGDFPLIDDWGYALPIENWLSTGELRFTGWQSMTLIAQLIWGTLFAAPFGFSFTALRISTLVAALFAVFAQANLVRSLGGDETSARWAALALVANPVFLLLSFTFMTDIPFLALALASTACLVRALKTDSTRAWALGFGLAAIGVLLRQMALALPMAFCVATAVRWGFGRRFWLGAFAPLIGIAVLLFGYEGAIEAAGLQSKLYPIRSEALGQAIRDLLSLNLGVLRFPIERGFQMLLYTGLFVAPAALVLGGRALAVQSEETRRRSLLGITITAVFGSVALIAIGDELPRFGHILFDLGTGVRTLPGPPPNNGAPDSFWWLLTAISVACVSLVLMRIAAPLIEAFGRPDFRERITPSVFLVALVTIYFGPLGLAYGPSFERYFLFPAAVAIALASAPGRGESPHSSSIPPSGSPSLPPPGHRVRAAGVLAVLLWGYVAVGGAHDYMDWNRARYALTTELEAAGHAPSSIDAGFDYASWRFTVAALAEGRQGGRVDQPDAPIAIRFSPEGSGPVLAERSLDGWLPGAPTRIVAIERAGGSQAASRP